MTIPSEQVVQAIDRLMFLAKGCRVDRLDHLPPVSRANAGKFADDLDLLLASHAHLSAENEQLNVDANYLANRVVANRLGMEAAQAEASRLQTLVETLRGALEGTQKLVSEGAAQGFTDHDWMDRLYRNQAVLSATLNTAVQADG